MSKYQTKIFLMKRNEDGKYEKKTYTSAEFLPGSVVEDASDVLDTMSKASDKKSVTDALSKAYAFIADVLYEGQFTGDDYRNGVDAREIAPLTGKLLRSVVAGFDETYSDTKKK